MGGRCMLWIIFWLVLGLIIFGGRIVDSLGGGEQVFKWISSITILLFIGSLFYPSKKNEE